MFALQGQEVIKQSKFAKLEVSKLLSLGLSTPVFLHIYVFYDICCHLQVAKMAIISTGPIANHCHLFHKN